MSQPFFVRAYWIGAFDRICVLLFHIINIICNFDILLKLHLSIFISVINQLDAQNFCFTISLFHASTCFEHMCSKHVEAWNNYCKTKILCIKLVNYWDKWSLMSTDFLSFFPLFIILTTFNLLSFGLHGYCYSWLHSHTHTHTHTHSR